MGSSNGKPILTNKDLEVIVKSSGLDESTIKRYFDNFVNDHPDGKMSKAEFKEMMEKALPKMDTTDVEEHVFRIYDTDNDGQIDFTEFMMNRW